MYRNMGRKGTDVITGIRGIVTGYSEYISGCNQVLIARRASGDGALPEAQWLDEQRVRFDPDAPVVLDNSASRGPDKVAPVR